MLVRPVFERQLIEDHREDGYWIESFDITGDGRPDLVAYGLGVGEVNWYENPSWQKRPIATFPGPVGMHHADIDGDGREDVVICYQYGMTMTDCDPNGGKIVWLHNPGDTDGEWEARYIGRATSMHRLKVGHFTRTDRWQVLALPIVGEPHALHSITPVLIFTEPADLMAADAWDEEVVQAIDEVMTAQTPVTKSFHVIHGAAVKHYAAADGSDLDSALLASEEGITWLHYDADKGVWRATPIGAGELLEVSTTGFKGSGDVDAGRVGTDDFAYIAAVEPFHGNTVAVYLKADAGAPANSLSGTWQRQVLDVYGDPNPLGEGPGHYVVCADFDNDGDDEFLVAMRGPQPYQGVFYYKAIDLAAGAFAKWRVAEDSAARIAVGDFDGDGRLDFATIGYSVGGYYCAENPAVTVYLNRFAPA